MLERLRFSGVRSYTLLGMSILLLFAVSTARGYTYDFLGEETGGWDDIKRGPATYVLDRSDYTPDLGLSEPEITTALNNAFDTWSSVDNSFLALREKRDRGGNYDIVDGPFVSLDPAALISRQSSMIRGAWGFGSRFLCSFAARKALPDPAAPENRTGPSLWASLAICLTTRFILGAWATTSPSDGVRACCLNDSRKKLI